LNSVNQGSDKISLQRSVLAVPWASSGASQIAFRNNTTFTTLLSEATPWAVSPGVVGFQIMFRRQDGSVIPSSAYTGEDFTHGPVLAIGVAIAVVDKQTFAEMTATQVSTFAGQIAAVPIPVNTSAKADWDQNIGPTILNQYPKNLSTNFRTFERWVSCQPF